MSVQIDYPQLFEAFTVLLNTILQFFSHKVNPPRVQGKESSIMPSSLSYRLLHEWKSRILSTKEFTDFKEELFDVYYSFNSDFVIVELVAEACARSIIYDFDSKEHHPIVGYPGYLELEDAIKTSRYERCFTFLYGFESEMDTIQIGEGLQIRRVNLIERAIFRNRPEIELSWVIEEMLDCSELPEYVVEITRDSLNRFVKEPSGVESSLGMIDYVNNSDIIGDLIGIIRLVNPSYIGIRFMRYHDIYGYWDAWENRQEVMPAFYGGWKKPEVFTASKIKFLQTVWEKFVGVRANERLQRVIRRYNSAIISEDLEDRLVDLIISLETLFQGMGHKIEFMASFLYGMVSENSEKAMNILEISYRLRNRTVHGGSIDGKKHGATIDELLPLVSQIITMAILLQMSGKSLSNHVKQAYLDSKEYDVIKSRLQNLIE
jgi:hypothetical protein